MCCPVRGCSTDLQNHSDCDNSEDVKTTLSFIHLLCSSSSVPSVYCCCCLANVSLPGIGVSVPELRPFFYINVADITALETEMSYVACESNFLLLGLLLYFYSNPAVCVFVCLLNC